MTTSELLILCHTVTNSSVAEILNANQMSAEQGDWAPACGGSEVPFMTRGGKTLLYCYQASTRKHAYLDCDSDVILTLEEANLYLGKM
jgi:hypothetical protein